MNKMYTEEQNTYHKVSIMGTSLREGHFYSDIFMYSLYSQAEIYLKLIQWF